MVEHWAREFGLDRAREVCRHDQQAPETAIRLADPEAEAELRRSGIDLAPGLLLTSARRSEAAAMTWAELDGADWILPAARNKTGVDLVRPLSKAAQEILAKLPHIVSCPFVFTSDGRSALGGFSRRKQRFDAACGVADWTIHDLRRTARSLMSRAGVNPDHAERCLGHVIGGVRETYDRHAYHAEKKKAFEALAAQIECIINPPQGDVVPLRGRR